MHAVLITFHSSVPAEDLVEPFTAYAEQLCSVPGLVAKTWIRDGEILGGFHVFSSRADADNYLSSEMVAGLTSNEAFEDFSIERYEVLDDLSRITGTPSRALAAVS
jgi:hypothetical protein